MKHYFRNLWLALVGHSDRRVRNAYLAGYIRAFYVGDAGRNRQLSKQWPTVAWNDYRQNELSIFEDPLDGAYRVILSKRTGVAR